MAGSSNRAWTISCSIVCLALGIAVACPVPARANLLAGIGAMGDSLTDEYQFVTYSYAQNWLEQLAVHRGLNFGEFTTTQRPEPRLRGYEFNWARNGASTSTMLNPPLAQGQHLGLAEQVANGEVTLAFLGIGANDFSPGLGGSYNFIYANDLTGTSRTNFVNLRVDRIRTAIDTVTAAGPVEMVLATIPDYGLSPLVQFQFPDATRRQRVTSVIDEVNDGIIALGQERGFPVIDLLALARDGLAVGGQIQVGGVTIDLLGIGTDPRNGFVADGIHPHTVVQGLIANLFLEAVNIAFGDRLEMPLELFSDLELLTHAGLEAEYTGETFAAAFPYANYVIFTPVPEPSTLVLLASGALLLGGQAWRRTQRPARHTR